MSGSFEGLGQVESYSRSQMWRKELWARGLDSGF